jgi:hypothetical protein
MNQPFSYSAQCNYQAKVFDASNYRPEKSIPNDGAFGKLPTAAAQNGAKPPSSFFDSYTPAKFDEGMLASHLDRFRRDY